MKNNPLYQKIKNSINQDHAIFMFGTGDNLLQANFTLVRDNNSIYGNCFISCYEYGLPTIFVDVKNSRSKDTFDKVIVVCHEYGHFISWQQNKRESEMSADNQYAYYHDNKKISVKQKKSILEEEVRAWSHARQHLKKYLPASDFRWKRFNNMRKSCLRSYKVSLKLI